MAEAARAVVEGLTRPDACPGDQWLFSYWAMISRVAKHCLQR